MNCGNAIKLIEKLDQAKQGAVELTVAEQADFQKLLQEGYFADTTIQPVDLTEINEKKNELANLQSTIISLKENISRVSDFKSIMHSAQEKSDRLNREKELEANLVQEKKIRTEILELSAKASSAIASFKIGEQSYILTFKAREIMEEIYARFTRVKDMELTALEREIQLLQSLFESNAQKAFKMLNLLSSKFRSIEEIHLRSAVIGLSLRPESPENIAMIYSTAMDLLVISRIEPIAQNRVYIAECLVHNLQNPSQENIRSSVNSFFQIYQLCIRMVNTASDAINCALLLHPTTIPLEAQEKILSDAIDFARKHIIFPTQPQKLEPEQVEHRSVRAEGIESEIPIAPFLLLLLSNGIESSEKGSRFDAIFPQLHQPGVTSPDAALAAAILALSKDNIDILINRYSVAKSYFGQITDLQMILPAAILSLVSSDIEETWDSLRIASTAISRAKMSLGGLENLSLAAKLLLFSSLVFQQEKILGKEVESIKIIPKETYIPPTLQILAFTTLPIVINAFTTIHTQTFHQTAVVDYHYHPIHFHYRYYHG